MNNMHDALKSGGLFWIKTPDALNWMDGAFGDPTHKRFFVPRSWNYLDITHQTWKEYGSAYGFKGWYVNVFTDKRFFICELTKP
jgi:hypothetical protein